MEFIELGHHLRYVHAKVVDWNKFVRIIDGSVLMYKKRAWLEHRENTTPSGSRRLFFDKDYDDHDSNSQEGNK